MLSQIHGPSEYYQVKRRHFPFTLTPLEKTKPALHGAKCIANDHRETAIGKNLKKIPIHLTND
jgi:hypothetical protein